LASNQSGCPKKLGLRSALPALFENSHAERRAGVRFGTSAFSYLTR
jgi:hypothetical protein